jgi:hypothetical protein
MAACGARWRQFSNWIAKVDPGQRPENEFSPASSPTARAVEGQQTLYGSFCH